MVEGKYITLPVDIKNYLENTFKILKPSINRQIKVLNLSHIYCFDTVKSDVYIVIHNFCIADRLIFDSQDNIFTYKKLNGSKRIIKNFNGWLLQTTFNHLKQVRTKRNLIESPLNIDNCKIICRKSIILSLESSEIKDKLEQLDLEDRKIIELHYFEDITYKEIAKIFTQEGFGNLTVSALRKKKQRAIEKLRDIY